MFVVSLSHFVSVSEPSVSASRFSLVNFLFLSDNVFVCKVMAAPVCMPNVLG